ncbi:MAG: GxxExxY protein [Candidatus Omnitrophota bacterium]
MIKNEIMQTKNDLLTQKIIACAYKVHSELGPGFNEKTYHSALKLSLEEEKLICETEKQCKVIYHGKQVGIFRLDLVVQDTVIVEVKAVNGYMPKVFEAQILSYLKVADYGVGLLINFGNKSCQIRRLVAKSSLKSFA